jgi:hypothetical protein
VEGGNTSVINARTRVVLERQLAVRLLDLRRGRPLLDAQDVERVKRLHLAVRHDQPHQVDEDEAAHHQQRQVAQKRWPPQPCQPRCLPLQLLGLFPFRGRPWLRPHVARRHKRTPHLRQGKPCPRNQIDHQARDGKVMERIVVVVQHLRRVSFCNRTVPSTMKASELAQPVFSWRRRLVACALFYNTHSQNFMSPRRLHQPVKKQEEGWPR